MDTTFMSNVVTSGTTVLTDTVGALFTFVTSIIPALLAIMAVGLFVYLIKWVLRKGKRLH